MPILKVIGAEEQSGLARETSLESVRSENVKRLAKQVLEATCTDVKGRIFETFHQA